MMDESELRVLSQTLARQSSSLLLYLRGAWPWTPASDQPAIDRLRSLQAEEFDATRKLGEFLLKNRGTPSGPVFPEEFTTLHFVGLDHLLPRLVSFQQWLLQGCEIDLAKLTDAKARALGESLVEMNRRHLAELEALAQQHSGAGTASTRR
jgi:hypothetical protein